MKNGEHFTEKQHVQRYWDLYTRDIHAPDKSTPSLATFGRSKDHHLFFGKLSASAQLLTSSSATTLCLKTFTISPRLPSHPSSFRPSTSYDFLHHLFWPLPNFWTLPLGFANWVISKILISQPLWPLSSFNSSLTVPCGSLTHTPTLLGHEEG